MRACSQQRGGAWTGEGGGVHVGAGLDRRQDKGGLRTRGCAVAGRRGVAMPGEGVGGAGAIHPGPATPAGQAALLGCAVVPGPIYVGPLGGAGGGLAGEIHRPPHGRGREG